MQVEACALYSVTHARAHEAGLRARAVLRRAATCCAASVSLLSRAGRPRYARACRGRVLVTTCAKCDRWLCAVGCLTPRSLLAHTLHVPMYYVPRTSYEVRGTRYRVRCTSTLYLAALPCVFLYYVHSTYYHEEICSVRVVRTARHATHIQVALVPAVALYINILAGTS